MFAKYAKPIHAIFPYPFYAVAGILIPTTCSTICQKRKNQLQVFQYMFGMRNCVTETDVMYAPKTTKLVSNVICFVRFLHLGIPLPASILISVTTDIVTTNVGKMIANTMYGI
jgi:hypothetical protein